MMVAYEIDAIFLTRLIDYAEIYGSMSYASVGCVCVICD